MVMYLRPESCAAATASVSGALAAHLGELHQHRQIDAGEHLDLGPAHHGNRQVRGSAAEHVGQDGDAFAGVHALDRLDDVLAALLDVVVGADGDRLDLPLRSHHVLEGRAELDGETPVRDQNETDHRDSPRARPRCTARKGAHHDHPESRRKGLSGVIGQVLHRGKEAPSGRRCEVDFERPRPQSRLPSTRYFCATGCPRKVPYSGLMSRTVVGGAEQRQHRRQRVDAGCDREVAAG